MTLRVDWCSYTAAKYAVMHWHYSRKMPKGKSAHIGVWEDERFIGSIVYGTGGGNVTNGKRWGLARTFEVAELERVALTKHAAPVSRIVAIACKLIARRFPGIKLLVSYADPREGHHGGIYQALGWTYIGVGGAKSVYKDKHGRVHHDRVIGYASRIHFGRLIKSKISPDQCERVEVPQKHCYVLALSRDAALREKIAAQSKPYPKRPKVARAGDQPAEGGADSDPGAPTSPA